LRPVARKEVAETLHNYWVVGLLLVLLILLA